MNTSYRFALSGLCVAVATAVAAEFILATPASTRATPMPEAMRAFSAEAVAVRADGKVAEILKHPLFTEGREPPRPKVVKAEPPRLQGRLAGVMLRADRREALFTRPGGRPVGVKEGDPIDGFTLSKVESDRVVLTSAFGEQVVKPTNGGPDEGAPTPRPVLKKTAPTKGRPAKPDQPQNAAPPQRQQQAAAAGMTGLR
jgi:type II secretory pathway component PulC